MVHCLLFDFHDYDTCVPPIPRRRHLRHFDVCRLDAIAEEPPLRQPAILLPLLAAATLIAGFQPPLRYWLALQKSRRRQYVTTERYYHICHADGRHCLIRHAAITPIRHDDDISSLITTYFVIYAAYRRHITTPLRRYLRYAIEPTTMYFAYDIRRYARATLRLRCRYAMLMLIDAMAIIDLRLPRCHFRYFQRHSVCVADTTCHWFDAIRSPMLHFHDIAPRCAMVLAASPIRRQATHITDARYLILRHIYIATILDAATPRSHSRYATRYYAGYVILKS